MMIHRAYRFRIYPDLPQRVLIHKILGCVRFVYNYFLERCYNELIISNRWPSYEDCANGLPSLKQQYPWLKEADSIALQQSLRNLKRAYVNHVKHKKDGHKLYGNPRYKSKHDVLCTYRTQNVNHNIRIEGDTVKLPLLGRIRISKSRQVDGRIIGASVSRTSTGKYYVSLCCMSSVEPLPFSGKEVGIDMGIKEFLHTSENEAVQNPAFHRNGNRKIKQEQRALARKKKGSSNWRKQKLKLAKTHEKVAQQRMDFLHKLSTRLIQENQLIAVESLKVRNMVKNHHLAGAISDASWGAFLRMLEYKALWYGRTLVKVDTFYPSSQTCSICGEKNPKVKDLSVREWICPHCGGSHDRDHNAAKNILLEGKRILKIA